MSARGIHGDTHWPEHNKNTSEPSLKIRKTYSSQSLIKKIINISRNRNMLVRVTNNVF